MSVIKNIFGIKNDSKTVSNESKKKLYNELKRTCAQLACTEMWFQMEDDEDLIDASIYQREALNARYRYLIRQAKANNVEFMQS